MIAVDTAHRSDSSLTSDANRDTCQELTLPSSYAHRIQLLRSTSFFAELSSEELTTVAGRLVERICTRLPSSVFIVTVLIMWVESLSLRVDQRIRIESYVYR